MCQQPIEKNSSRAKDQSNNPKKNCDWHIFYHRNMSPNTRQLDYIKQITEALYVLTMGHEERRMRSSFNNVDIRRSQLIYLSE